MPDSFSKPQEASTWFFKSKLVTTLVLKAGPALLVAQLRAKAGVV